MSDWRTLVADHGPTVWRTVYRIVADHADALDCFQETFLSAYESPQRESVRDWAAYLTTLAARRAIDRLRERDRLGRRVTSLDHAPPPMAREPDPADQAVAIELMDQVRRALAGMADRQAEVFWLSCVEGLSHHQIATQLQSTPGTIRVLLHRARTSLSLALNSLETARTKT
jgi:RNA polymerase sigma-70 factor (ECF subfamily)